LGHRFLWAVFLKFRRSRYFWLSCSTV
jgi:hypothetical protein